MRCDQVYSLLSLDDERAHCDRYALYTHLESCPRCADAWPEVAPLVRALKTVAPSRSEELPLVQAVRRRRLHAPLAVVLLLVAAGVTSLWEGEEWRPELGTPIAEQSRHRSGSALPSDLRPSATAITRATVVHERGRRVESRITEGRWEPPLPHCLAMMENAK